MGSVPLVFGVETMLRPTTARNNRKWYRGVVEAAECLMAMWHSDEVESSCLRHAAEEAKSDDKGIGGGEGGGSRTDMIPLSTNAKMQWYSVWQGTDSTNMWNLS